VNFLRALNTLQITTWTARYSWPGTTSVEHVLFLTV
jgi:hypothetical protein